MTKYDPTVLCVCRTVISKSKSLNCYSSILFYRWLIYLLLLILDLIICLAMCLGMAKHSQYLLIT